MGSKTTSKHGAGRVAKPRKVPIKLIATGVMLCVMAMILAPVISWALPVTPSYTWYTSNPDATEFTITSEAEFAGFAQLVNGTADTNGDGSADMPAQTFAGKTVKLAATLNFLQHDLVPVGGADATQFDGIFDGQGHTVDNFKLSADGRSSNIGIFGHAGPSSMIKNVTVGNATTLTLTYAASENVAVKNIGMLIGCGEGAMENCVNKGSLTITNNANQTKLMTFPIQNVGGLAGICMKDITSCSNSGPVVITEGGTPYKPEASDTTGKEQNALVVNVGGVVGSAGDVDTTINKESTKVHGSVIGCTNSAQISVNTPSDAGSDRFGNSIYVQSTNVGGIAGYSRGSIDNCSNSGYLRAEHATSIGGIVGGLRAKTTDSSYSGNFSDEGSDDGAAGDYLTITNCRNSGVLYGYAQVAGIAGRAGTYSTIESCLNEKGTYVVGTRTTKPFPSGIVGGTYGTVAYCANLGTIAAGKWSNEATHAITASGGYFAAGIAGSLSYFTQDDVISSPLPELYGCYNAGQIMAIDNMRQRNLVGDNAGYVHDNVAQANLCYGDKLVYGDSPDDTESSGGTTANNKVVTADNLKNNTIISGTETTVLFILNLSGDRDGWDNYWVKSDGGTNAGYPALNTQVTWALQDVSGATVSLKANAQYTGTAAVPQAYVTTVSGKGLTQGVDFKVIPQADAIEVTADGQTPYVATIEGIGNYSGTATQTLAYGIGKGDLSTCTVLIDSKVFDWEAQELTADDVHVTNLGGNTVSPSEYTFAFNTQDPDYVASGNQARDSLPDGYEVTVTASPSSMHFIGTAKGVFKIKSATIACNKDAELQEKNAYPTKISYMGQEYDWQSLTVDPNVTDANLLHLEYTGYPVKPQVTNVTYLGEDLDQGRDYRVVYGATVIDGSTVVDGEENLGVEGSQGYGYIMVRYVSGGNFHGYDIMKFLIVDTGDKIDLATAEVQGTSDIIFEQGQTYTPITVWYGGSKLVEGTDYTITYTDNDKIGTAHYTITAVEGSNYTGTKSGTFDIVEGVPYTFTYGTPNDADHTIAVTGVIYKGSATAFDMVIPTTTQIGGVTYAVTSIAGEAFGGNEYADFIGSDVNLSKLKIRSVEIPASIKSIGQYAFASYSTTEWTKLESVAFADIGNSQLTTIGVRAFQGCGHLTSFTFPANVATIEVAAFSAGNDAVKHSGIRTLTFLTKSATLPSSVSASLTFSGVGYDGEVTVNGYASATAVKALATANSGATPGVNAGRNFTFHTLTETHTVAFADPQGATTTASQQVVAGAFASEPAAPTRTGYSFAGWHASEDGGATLAADPFDFAGTAITQDVTLYAKWTENPYLSLYTKATADAAPVLAYTFTKAQVEALAQSGSVSAQYFKSGAWQVATSTNYVTIQELLDTASLTIAGADSVTAASSDGFSATATWSAMNAGSFFPDAGPASYETTNAVPTAAVLGLTYASSATTTTSGAAATLNAASQTTASCPKLLTGIAQASFNADGASTAGAGKRLASSVTTLTVTRAVTHTVAFADPQGATTTASQQVVAGAFASEPAAPTRTGYSFAGWHASEDGGATLAADPFDFAGTAITQDVTLYAKWMPETPRIDSALGSQGNYGYAPGSLTASVAATAPTEGSVTGYQWYETDATGVSSTLVGGATEAIYALPSGKDAGAYYFFCIVSGIAKGGEAVSARTDVLPITVCQAASEIRFVDQIDSPAVVTKSANSITLKAATVDAGAGAVTYAIATVNAAPVAAEAWQTSTTFTSLVPATTYYVFARVAATGNYTEATTAGFVVSTKAAGLLDTPGLTATTFDPKKTLSDIMLPSGWAWDSASTTPLCTNAGYAATYTPSDSGAVDYSTVEGYDVVTGKVHRTLALTVNKATPTLVAPVASAVTFGQSLAASTLGSGSAYFVSLKDASQTAVSGTFAWKSNTPIPAVSDSLVTHYAAVFTPTGDDAANYKTTETTVVLEVMPKAAQSASVSISAVTYTGSPITPQATVVLEGKTLIAGIDYLMTATNNINPGQADYAVTFLGNYEGTVQGTFTITPRYEFVFDDVSAAGLQAEDLAKVLDAYKAHYPDAKSLVIHMSIASASSDSEGVKAIQAYAAGMTFDGFHEILLTLQRDGEGAEDIGSDNTQLVKMTYPFDFSGKQEVRVFTYHEGHVYELTTTPNEYGEYIVLDTVGNKVIVYAKRYSTYGIGYAMASSSGSDTSGGTTLDTSTGSSGTATALAPTGDTTPLFIVGIVVAALLVSCGIIGTAMRRGRTTKRGMHS